MSALWITIFVLQAVVSLLFLGAGWRQRQASSNDRDCLNTDFYHQRLRELEEDEAQGVIGERATMVSELQQTLLNDVPPAEAARSRASSRLVLLPGVLLLVAASLGMYLKSGGLTQVASWIAVQQEYPSLRARDGSAGEAADHGGAGASAARLR
nr:Cytochrome c-type biogenesis protein CcmH precursor [Candidatus Pantoea persica]